MKKDNSTQAAGSGMSGDSLFDQIANITKAHAYDITVEQVKELKEIGNKLLQRALEAEAENEKLIREIETLKSNKEIAMILALEFGYKQCEKGENIQAAFLNYDKVIKPQTK